jgi:hypothetical protein
MSTELMRISHTNRKVYANTASNVIGATEDPLRVMPALNLDTYVQRGAYQYINDLSFNSLTARSAASNSWIWHLYGNNKLTKTGPDNYIELLTVTDTGGATSAVAGLQMGNNYSWYDYKITLECTGGTTAALTSSDFLNLVPNVAWAADNIFIKLPDVTISSGDEISFYMGIPNKSDGLDDMYDMYCYYDRPLTMSQNAPTPTGAATAPYLTLADGIANVAVGGDIVINASQYFLENDLAFTTNLYANNLKKPVILYRQGVSKYLIPDITLDDTTSVFFNNNGSDSGTGTYADPFKTLEYAVTNRGGLHVTMGGEGVESVSDSFVYVLSNAIIIDNYQLQPQAGYILNIGVNTTTGITVQSATSKIKNVNFTDLGTAEYINIDSPDLHTTTISNCTFGEITNNGSAVIVDSTFKSGDVIINDCVFLGGENAIIVFASNLLGGFSTVNRCYFENYTNAINLATGVTYGGPILNNVFSYCTYGLLTTGTGTLTYPLEHCVYSYCDYGTYGASAFVPTSLNCVFFDCVEAAMDGYGVGNYCNFTNNSEDDAGSTSITNEVVGFAEFTKPFDPTRYGFSSDSVCFQSGDDGTDLGIYYTHVTTSKTMNGIFIDCDNKITYPLLATGTAQTIDNCTFTGGTSSGYLVTGTTVINDCKSYNNGVGGQASAVTTSFNNSLFYENYYSGVTIPNGSTDLLIDNCVMNLNQYGFYYDGGDCQIIDSIISGNDQGIVTDSLFFSNITYSCINDTVDDYTNISDVSNRTNDPLFIDSATVGDDKNLNIKTIDAGYFLDSPCYKTDSTGADMGGYTFSARGLQSVTWKKYTFEFNPAFMNINNIVKGLNSTDDGRGNLVNWGKAHKRIFPMTWNNDSASSITQYKMVRYFSTLIETRENGLLSNEVELLLWEKPSAKMWTGTTDGVNLDATAKTFTDSGASLIYDELKGYDLNYKVVNETSGSNWSASGKTITDSGASWVVNQWAGWLVEYNGFFYLIASNTATVLTVTDPDSTLTDRTNVAYSISKYFKILSNTDTVITVDDVNNELENDQTGKNASIDFITVYVQNSNFSPSQLGYSNNERSITGYGLTFEEK